MIFLVLATLGGAVGVSVETSLTTGVLVVLGSLGGVGPAGTNGGSSGLGLPIAANPGKLLRSRSALVRSHTIPSSPL